MLNLTTDMSKAQGIRADIQYEAVVVNNDDSKSEDGRRLCRIQARIKGIFDGIEDAHLPWAIPDYIHSDGASGTSGDQAIPKIGTKVLLTFQEGSIDHPIYTGYHVDTTTILEEMYHNYPDRKVLRLQNNLVIVVDTKTNEIFIRSPGAFNIFIEGDANLQVMGNMTEKVMGNKTTYVKGNLTEIVEGSRLTNVKAGDSLLVDGPRVERVSGSRGQHVMGSNVVYTDGSDEHHSASAMLRTAPYINDDLPQGSAPSAPPAPPVPTLAKWPGIRGNNPS